MLYQNVETKETNIMNIVMEIIETFHSYITTHSVKGERTHKGSFEWAQRK